MPKLELTEFSGDPLKWPEWSGLFDVVVHQKPISDTEKMQYLKTGLTGRAKAEISGMGFSSQSYYHAWDILCEKYGRLDVTVNAQLKKYILILQFNTTILRALSNLQMRLQML